MRNRILNTDNVRKTINYLKKNGFAGTIYAAAERVQEERAADYRYLPPDAKELQRQRQESQDYPWLFSIVTPAYETKEEHLREMIASVQAQSYPNWELIIVDAGESDKVERTVRRIIHDTGDLRIRYSRLSGNGGIAENTNAGIALAKGDYIALLDHDDFITHDALYYMARSVQQGRQENLLPALLYSDEDKYDEGAGIFVSPHVKQKFNLDLIMSNNYICHFLAMEAGLIKSLLLRGEYDGAQDYDLVLRAVDSLWPRDSLLPDTARIRHIPRVLYHWRSHRDSTALNTGSKTYAYEAGRRALSDFCEKRGFQARVEHNLHLGFYNVYYEPDILSVRKDVGAVGGRLLDGHGRVFAGAYDENGSCLFEGLPARFTGGSTHRATLVQDCAAVDIRFVRLREELWPLFSEVTGLSYRERSLYVKTGGRKKEIRIADVEGLSCDEAGYRKLSMALGTAVQDAGYLVVWDPSLSCEAGKRRRP
ncbi:MAG: glycosyltransferase [Lachnospiraceae bacterium]|nr:glycosyltransferase [Lachnospiraceae bacterium]